MQKLGLKTPYNWRDFVTNKPIFCRGNPGSFNDRNYYSVAIFSGVAV